MGTQSTDYEKSTFDLKSQTEDTPNYVRLFFHLAFSILFYVNLNKIGMNKKHALDKLDPQKDY